MAIRKVVSRSIGTDVIAAEDLAANSVTVAEIQDGAVTTAKIADGDVTSAKLDTNVNVSGTLGVGGTATQGKFHVVGSGGLTGGNVQNVGAGNQIVIENNASGGSADIQMLGPTNGYNHIFFGDGDDPNVGVMYYDHNNNSIGIQTGAATRLRIDSDGLKFGSDSAAANALDDYEEGTFTLTVTPGSGSLTPYDNIGQYRKVGSLVFVTAWWRNNGSLGSSASGSLTIGGLPYPASALITQTRTRLPITGYAFASLSNRSGMEMTLATSSTSGALFSHDTSFSSGYSLTAGNIGTSNAEIYLNGWYYTDS